MNQKKKIFIFSFLIIIGIHILLFINNNQKGSFRYLIWNIEDISIGKLINISFFSGLIVSSILNITLNNNLEIKSINVEDQKKDENDYSPIGTDNNDSFNIPPERDVRDTQPTISVNYRVIKNNNLNELNNRNETSSNSAYQDDWNNNDIEW